MKIKIFHLIGIAYILAFILSALVTMFNDAYTLVISGGYLLVFTLIVLSMFMQNKKILNRSTAPNIETGYMYVMLMLLMGIATMVTASATVQNLPSWTQYLGLFLLLLSSFISTQTLNSYPPFAKELYNEDPTKDMEQGTYSTLRVPFGLCTILMLLSIPLSMGAPLAFIPAGLGCIFTIVWVSILDHWRFVNYEWYYDYTKRAPYKIFPFIW